MSNKGIKLLINNTSVGDVIGDFKCIDVNEVWANIKYIDNVTSCVISHWGDGDIHVLHNYNGYGTYTCEEIIVEDNHRYLKKHERILLNEGIIIHMTNTPMDNIKVDIDSSIGRYRKEVLDIR